MNYKERELLFIIEHSIVILTSVMKKIDYREESLSVIDEKYLHPLINILEKQLNSENSYIAYTDDLVNLIESITNIVTLTKYLSEHIKLNLQITNFVYDTTTNKC